MTNEIHEIKITIVNDNFHLIVLHQNTDKDGYCKACGEKMFHDKSCVHYWFAMKLLKKHIKEQTGD